jgi:hypothetical protein
MGPRISGFTWWTTVGIVFTTAVFGACEPLGGSGPGDSVVEETPRGNDLEGYRSLTLQASLRNRSESVLDIDLKRAQACFVWEFERAAAVHLHMTVVHAPDAIVLPLIEPPMEFRQRGCIRITDIDDVRAINIAELDRLYIDVHRGEGQPPTRLTVDPTLQR